MRESKPRVCLLVKTVANIQPVVGVGKMRLLQWSLFLVIACVFVAHVPALASNNLLPRRVALHLVAALLLAGGGLGAKPRLSRSVTRGLVGLGVTALVTCLLSEWRWLSLPGTLDALSSVFCVASVATVCVSRRSVLYAILVLVLLGALLGLAEQWLPFSLGEATRPAGPFASRVTAGALAAASLPLCCIVFQRRHWLAVLSIAVLVAFLVTTRTRAAWLAGAMTIVVLVVRVASLRRAVLLGTFAGALFAAVSTPGPRMRWVDAEPYSHSLMTLLHGEVGDRAAVWRESLRLLAARPLGTGVGTFEAAFAAASPTLPASLSGVIVEAPHLEALRLAIEFGWVFVPLLLSFWPRRGRASTRTRCLRLSLMALALCSLAAKTFSDPPTLLLACVVVGLLFRGGEHALPRWVSLSALLLFAVAAAVLDVRMVRASAALATAQRLARSGDVRSALEVLTPQLPNAHELSAWRWALSALAEADDTSRCHALAQQAPVSGLESQCGR